MAKITAENNRVKRMINPFAMISFLSSKLLYQLRIRYQTTTGKKKISNIIIPPFMKIQDLTKQILKEAKLPPLELELILAFVLKKSREFLFTHPEYELNKFQISDFRFKISERLKGVPIAYITGHKEFYGLDFLVNQNVMIPRPETELMVDEAMKLVTHLSAEALAEVDNTQHTIIIDVGTGSGNIIITLAKILKDRKLSFGYSKLSFRFYAADISKKALAVARKNAKLHQVDDKIKFLQGNLLEAILKSKTINHKSKILILANLPYGWKEWKNNCSMDTIGLKYEPVVALFTNKNGLELYEKLLKQINYLMTNYQLSRFARSGEARQITCLLEFDTRQTAKLKMLIKKEMPTATYEIKKDLCGLNRLAIIEFVIPAAFSTREGGWRIQK